MWCDFALECLEGVCGGWRSWCIFLCFVGERWAELMCEFHNLPHKPLSLPLPLESASPPAPVRGVGGRIILGVWPQIGRARPSGAGVIKGEAGKDAPRKSARKHAEVCECREEADKTTAGLTLRTLRLLACSPDTDEDMDLAGLIV